MRNNNIIFMVSLLALTLTGCGFNDDYALVSPDEFKVEAPATVKVGEPVSFEIAGDPDLIMFYSGEFGHLYENRNKDILYEATMTMSFETETSSVETPGMNPAKVPLLISSDFSGEYTKEAVEAATWTDISDKFNWPAGQGEKVASGEVEMKDLFPDESTPIYLMFDYKVEAFSGENGRVQWYIRNLYINGGTELGISELYNLYTCGWHIVPIENYDANTSLPQMPTATNFRLQLRTQFKPAVDIEYAAVSAPIIPASSVNVGWDKGIPIKAFSDPQMKSYTYSYDEPGEYVVTFVATNANMNGQKSVARDIKIKVVQDEGSITSPTFNEWTE